MRLIDADEMLEQMKGMNMLFSPKIVIDNMPTVDTEQIIADAIEKYTCKSDCEYDGTCEMCVRWDKLSDCYEPPKEQMKEQNND